MVCYLSENICSGLFKCPRGNQVPVTGCCWSRAKISITPTESTARKPPSQTIHLISKTREVQHSKTHIKLANFNTTVI
jgi:hypothetical protein